MNWWLAVTEAIEKAGRKVATRQIQRDVILKLEEAFESLKSGRGIKPLLIRLPCGYGKTLIGEAPYLAQLRTGEWLTRGLVYTLPTRALTQNHQQRLQEDFQAIEPRTKVLALHGEEHSTGLFYADALVSTFDVFACAYARRARTGHHLEFPAGTIATSYVVFDEAHMFQDPYFYTHMILNRIIRTLSRVNVPCIVMTATMPTQIVDTVFAGVGYESIPDASGKAFQGEGYRGEIKELYHEKISPAEYASHPELPSRVKNDFGRVLMVCNTISNAQTVYKKIIENPNWPKTIEKIMIHSNLVKKERLRREQLAISLMSRQRCEGGCDRYGKGVPPQPIPMPVYIKDPGEGEKPLIYCEECGEEENDVRRIDSVFVVATQVVEAGLDISANWLITEVAPLDAIIQRSGRCARFPGENGEILILHHENPHSPYDHKLVNRASELLYESNRFTFLDMDLYTPMIDENYRVLNLRRPRDDLRQYLAYYEYLSTFSVDWELLEQIRARPETYVTLAFPKNKDDEVICYKTEEFTDGYRVTNEVSLSYEDLLRNLMNGEKLLFTLDFVDNMSFNLELGLATAERRLPKDFLTHQIEGKEEKVIIELELTRACFDSEKHYFYLARIYQPRRIKEGTYLANPKFYDDSFGLYKNE